MKKLIFLLLIFSLCKITNVVNAACVPTPDCESLGYKQVENDCPDNFIKCPWNTSFVYCPPKCPSQIVEPLLPNQCQIDGEDTCQPADLYNGERNTNALIEHLGAWSGAAVTAKLFYVGSEKGDFGIGKWYLPAIGELMDVYGFDVSKIKHYGDYYTGHALGGAIGNNKTIINKTLSELQRRGLATVLQDKEYSSSSEGLSCGEEECIRTEMAIDMKGGGIGVIWNKGGSFFVRAFLRLRNCFNFEGSVTPKIGDIVYVDRTWGSIDNYDDSKLVAGVVVSVKNGDVTIMSLKDLGEGEMDRHCAYTNLPCDDIVKIPDYSVYQFAIEIKNEKNGCL